VLRSLQGDISIRDGHAEFNHLRGTREVTHTETLVFVVCFYLLFAVFIYSLLTPKVISPNI